MVIPLTYLQLPFVSGLPNHLKAVVVLPNVAPKKPTLCKTNILFSENQWLVQMLFLLKKKSSLVDGL